ncbi:MAG: hypothetical protein NTU80_13405 [Verrucomicrobia bacterium]|nr:hypothetical protein [Verrucomicrobiota bacterium]
MLARAERAARVGNQRPDFFDTYADNGPPEFPIPDSLKVPPLSEIGNVSEIVARFGGTDQFRSAVKQLQEQLCAA